MAALRAVVFGQVQGVGFRAYAQRRARALGLKGEVWNRLDGAVELVFVHDSEAVLSQFEDMLAGGPGSVSSVRSGPCGVLEEWPDFEIGPTRP